MEEPVTQTLNRAGEAGTDAALARYGVTLAEFRDELGHNIPNVFADFFAKRGHRIDTSRLCEAC